MVQICLGKSQNLTQCSLRRSQLVPDVSEKDPGSLQLNGCPLQDLLEGLPILIGNRLHARYELN
jgi:hypothetical protein